MRAITIAKPKRLEKIEIESPKAPIEGEALVRTHRMGICGTDISSYLGKFPFFDYPRIPGHELGVEVIEVGPGAETIKPGDRCSVEPYLDCGNCYACQSGRTNCCASLKVIGVMCDGGLCDRFLIPASKLHSSSSLSYDQLALVETLAIGCHGTDRVSPRKGDPLLIIGAGPIGLSMLEFAQLAGARVTMMDQSPERLEFCQANYPIDAAILPSEWNDEQYPIVVDATGSHQSMSDALKYVYPGGKLLYLGVTTENLAIPHPKMHRAELTLLSSRNALPEQFTRIIELIERGQIATDRWITHRTTFDNVVEEFESFTHPKTGVIKAIIEVS